MRYSILRKNPNRFFSTQRRERRLGGNLPGSPQRLRVETRHSRYPNRLPKPPNDQKQARWGEAVQFEFRRHAGERGNAGVRFSGATPNVHA